MLRYIDNLSCMLYQLKMEKWKVCCKKVKEKMMIK